MAVEKPAATVIAENLGVQVADLDNDGRIDVVGDGRMEVGYGPTITIPRSPRPASEEAASGDTSGPQMHRREDGVVQGGEVQVRGRVATYERVETRYLNVDGRAVVGANVDQRTVVARGGIVATFPMARYFGPEGARALLGKKEGDVAAYATAVRNWGDTHFAGNATLAVEAAARGGFLAHVAPEVRTAALNGAKQNVAVALRQVRDAAGGDTTSNMGVYENAVRTVALLGQGDTNKPVVDEGKGTVAGTLHESHLAMQTALLAKGVPAREVAGFVQRVATATRSPVPVVAGLQPFFGNQATVSPK